MFEELNKILEGTVGENNAPTTLSGFGMMAINLLIGVGIMIGVISFGFAFIRYTMSGGDPKKLNQAWTAAIWAGVAIFISAISWTIKVIVFNWLGIDSELPDEL